MSPRTIDTKAQNYDLRRKSYQLMQGEGTHDNGLYVINTLFNTVTSVRNPKISFFFRDIIKMAKDEITLVSEGIRNTLAGFKDANDLTPRHNEDDVMVIPSWALRSEHPE